MSGGRAPGAPAAAAAEPLLLVLLAGGLFAYLAADLVSRSLALDGLVYANVALLVGDGAGAFWSMPHYEADVQGFYDHPPLGIHLLAAWMALTGDAFWSEKALAALLVASVTGLLAGLARQGGVPAWWALLAFAVMPATTYTLKNNFLESFVAVTAMAGAACGWRARERWAPWSALAGLLAFVGFLIKGPAALFPLAAPTLALLVGVSAPPQARLGRAVAAGAVAAGTAVACAAAVAALEPDSLEFLARYLKDQVLASVTGERPAEHGRWYLVGQLASNAGIAAIVLLVLARQMRRMAPVGWFWTGVALAASLPLLVSARHYRHYLLPALPFAALALAHAVPAPRWRLPAGVLRAAAAVSLAGAGALAAFHWGRPGDHAIALRDAAAIASHSGADTIGFCPDDESLRLRAYLYRHHRVRTTRAGADWIVCAWNPGGLAIAPLELAPPHTLWRQSAE